jgi:1D-myo-inositol 3-kinase
VNPEVRFDYTTVGHVTADVLSDGSRRPGGSAFYGALQAARLGARVLIVTQGAAREIEELTEPYRGELELQIFPAAKTTTLQTSGSGAGRRQRVLAWAGPIDEEVTIDTSILHLAPVARETPGRWRGSADFVGLTPQGLVRDWSGERKEMSPAPLTGTAADSAAPAGRPGQGHRRRSRFSRARTPQAMVSRLPENLDAVVVSEHERASCAGLIPEATRAGAVVAVTAGADPTTILLPGGGVVHVNVPAIEDPSDDVGAGDVFAAAFFVALAEGQAPDSAAAFANAASAVRIGGEGANAIGDRPAVEARLRAVA